MNINNFIAKQLSNPSGIGGKLVFSVMNRQNRPLYEDVIRLLSPSDSDNILDVGCGNGNVLNMLASCSGCTLAGVDFSESAIKSALSRNRKFVNSGRMNLVCQDMSSLPFPDSSFDKVYSINTVYFWNNLDDTLTEIRRVLKPNGLFLNALFTNETLDKIPFTQIGYTRYMPEELIGAGKNTGFASSIVPVFKGKAYCVAYHKED
ncbi:MAG: class I SAM-dependent methyltransferase [Defluviitaleaceae bacterium]|nr:class I SAM-dependent methyltransferase [Defluviitaleaceae bacterium]